MSSCGSAAAGTAFTSEVACGTATGSGAVVGASERVDEVVVVDRVGFLRGDLRRVSEDGTVSVSAEAPRKLAPVARTSCFTATVAVRCTSRGSDGDRLLLGDGSFCDRLRASLRRCSARSASEPDRTRACDVIGRRVKRGPVPARVSVKEAVVDVAKLKQQTTAPSARCAIAGMTPSARRTTGSPSVRPSSGSCGGFASGECRVVAGKTASLSCVVVVAVVSGIRAVGIGASCVVTVGVGRTSGEVDGGGECCDSAAAGVVSVEAAPAGLATDGVARTFSTSRASGLGGRREMVAVGIGRGAFLAGDPRGERSLRRCGTAVPNAMTCFDCRFVLLGTTTFEATFGGGDSGTLGIRASPSVVATFSPVACAASCANSLRDILSTARSSVVSRGLERAPCRTVLSRASRRFRQPESSRERARLGVEAPFWEPGLLSLDPRLPRELWRLMVG